MGMKNTEATKGTEMTAAKCGRTDKHGPHTEKRPEPNKPGKLLWCLGK
jgi:hypothetical protein